MTDAAIISIYILISASLLALMLEAISIKRFRTALPEEPHIRVMAIGVLLVALAFSIDGLRDIDAFAHLSTRSLGSIAMVFLIANTLIAIYLGDRSMRNAQDGEFYFLILASSVFAISSVMNSSLLLIMLSVVGFLTLITALAVRTTKGGKKAEIGIKLAFLSIALFLQFAIAIIILALHGHAPDLDRLLLDLSKPIPADIWVLFLLALAGLTLSAIPPFHFGHIDAADGCNSGVAFMMLTNSFIQGGVILYKVNSLLIASQTLALQSRHYLMLVLVVGFSILWLRALDQSRVRRCASYASVSLGPLVIMALIFGLSAGPNVIFVIAIFTFLTLSMFILFGSLISMSAVAGAESTWEDLAGFGRSKTWPSIIFMVGMISVAGLPGTPGFLLKLYLLSSIRDDLIMPSAVLLSIAIGAACSLRIFVFMFAKHPQLNKDGGDQDLMPSLPLVIACAALLILGFLPLGPYR